MIDKAKLVDSIKKAKLEDEYNEDDKYEDEYSTESPQQTRGPEIEVGFDLVDSLVSGECVICQDGFNPENSQVLTGCCGSCYHQGCLRDNARSEIQHYTKAPSCPKCRAKIFEGGFDPKSLAELDEAYPHGGGEDSPLNYGEFIITDPSTTIYDLRKFYNQDPQMPQGINTFKKTVTGLLE